MPQAVQDAATGIERIATVVEEANALVGLWTTGILPAGADEVSAAVAALFNIHGQMSMAMQKSPVMAGRKSPLVAI